MIEELLPMFISSDVVIITGKNTELSDFSYLALYKVGYKCV